MPCPFGFGAEDSGAADAHEQADGSDADDIAHDESSASDTESIECRQPGHNAHAPKQPQPQPKQVLKAAAESNKFETDPVAWFKANNITSDKDFQEKKTALQQEARRRLEALKVAKQKLLEFDSDMDEASLDDDFSDLHSDAHSLCSLGSHVRHWLEKHSFHLAAEAYLKYAAPAALAVTMVCAFQSYSVWALCTRVGGVVVNTNWAVGCFLMSLVAMLFVAVTYFSAVYRSKRMLLASCLGLLLVYSAVVALLALMHAQPTMLDEKLFEAACQRSGKHEFGSRLCNMMPAIRRDVSEAIPPFMSSVVAAGGCALGLVALSIWYMFELAYVEKKANKQRRRDKRSKHTIPWDKIKVTASWVASGGLASAGAVADAPVRTEFSDAAASDDKVKAA